MGEHLHDRRQFEHDIRHAIHATSSASYFSLRRSLTPTRCLASKLCFVGTTQPEVPYRSGGVHTHRRGVRRHSEDRRVGAAHACAEAASWDRPLGISVNVSAVQLHGGNLPELVEEVLKETGLDPSRLELEITESSLIKDIGRALAVLHKLKALGVQIAMDDFGTGYSSLSNLRAFPFDKIKVDQSLVRAVDTSDEAAAVMRAVFGLARGLKLPVLAEGVETDAELSFLREEACDEMQGYLLAHPPPFRHSQSAPPRKAPTPRPAPANARYASWTAAQPETAA